MQGSEDFTTRQHAKESLRTLLEGTSFGEVLKMMAELATEAGFKDTSEYLYHVAAQERRPPETWRTLPIQAWR